MIRLLHAAPRPVASASFATIALSPYQSAQGPVIGTCSEGRVVIDTGRGHLAGRPLAQGEARSRVWSPLFAGLI